MTTQERDTEKFISAIRDTMLDRIGEVQRKLIVVHRDTDLSRNAEYQRAVWNAHAAAEKAFDAAQDLQSKLEVYFNSLLTLARKREAEHGKN